MIDINGNALKAGDIMLEITGRESTIQRVRENGNQVNKIISSHIECKIYELPASTEGFGYHYDIDGKRYKFWWITPSNSHRITDIVDKEFVDLFKKGMQRLKSSADEWDDINSILTHSNYDERKKFIESIYKKYVKGGCGGKD